MTNQLNLATDGITMRDYSAELREAVEQAATAWREFVALPDETKDALAMQDAQFGVGYERKFTGERESADRKENFDVTQQGIEAIRNSAPGQAARLLETSASLLELLEPEVAEFGQFIEQAYGVQGMAKVARASAANCYVRYLHYPATSEGTMIGEPHTDHSGFTFHLYESTDGCERLALDRSAWLPMPVEPGKMAVFGGMQLQLASRGKLTALCHKITANRDTAQYGRIAMVCFVKLENIPTYDRKTHGRLQEKPAGFNYGMPIETFRPLFRNA